MENMCDCDLVRDHFLDDVNELDAIEKNFKNFHNDLLSSFFTNTLEKEIQVARQTNIIEMLHVIHEASAYYLKCTPNDVFSYKLKKISTPERCLYAMSDTDEAREVLFNDFCERGLQGLLPHALDDIKKYFERTLTEHSLKAQICSTPQFEPCVPIFLKLKAAGKLENLFTDLQRRTFNNIHEAYLIDCNSDINTIISSKDAMNLRKLEMVVAKYKKKALIDQCFNEIEKYCSDLPSK